MFELFILLFAALYCVMPLLTGYLAQANGRSFWRWFGLGLLLPFVSVFVIMIVATRDQLAEEKLAAQAPQSGPASDAAGKNPVSPVA
jgi:hypothetical protein